MATKTSTTPDLDVLATAKPAPRTPYFVYGSLMSSRILFSIICGPEIPATLTPRSLKANQMTRATLHKHKRHVVAWADFPAVVKTDKPEDFVEGYLVSGLTQLQEARIERFESGLYRDEGVDIVMGWGNPDGEMKEARVYIWDGAQAELINPAVREWTFKGFKKSSMYNMRFRGDSSESGGDEEEN